MCDATPYLCTTVSLCYKHTQTTKTYTGAGTLSLHDALPICLKQLREAKNMPQLRLAMELGVSQETISGYEIGKAVPPADMLVKLANALDTSVDYILGRTEIKSTLRASELRDDEAEILSILRRQSAEKRATVFDMIKGLEK